MSALSELRFYIDRQEGETECECPESLCVHPNRIRVYPIWYVLDRTGAVEQEPFEVYAWAVAERNARNRAEAAA